MPFRIPVMFKELSVSQYDPTENQLVEYVKFLKVEVQVAEAALVAIRAVKPEDKPPEKPKGRRKKNDPHSD